MALDMPILGSGSGLKFPRSQVRDQGHPAFFICTAALRIVRMLVCNKTVHQRRPEFIAQAAVVFYSEQWAGQSHLKERGLDLGGNLLLRHGKGRERDYRRLGMWQGLKPALNWGAFCGTTEVMPFRTFASDSGVCQHTHGAEAPPLSFKVVFGTTEVVPLCTCPSD